MSCTDMVAGFCSTCDWEYPQSSFCEGIFTGAPEYVGSFSSLGMSFVGAFGLFMGSNYNELALLVLAGLFFCGIGSFGYHWTLKFGWDLLDRFPMTICLSLGLYMQWREILVKLIGPPHRISRAAVVVQGLLGIAIMSLMFCVLALSAANDYADYYQVVFGVMNVFLVLGLFLMRFVTHKDVYKKGQTPDTPHKLSVIEKEGRYFSVMWRGFIISMVGAIFWLSTEPICPKFPVLRYFYAHAIWHLSIAYGMYCIVQFVSYVSAETYGCEASFLTSNNRYLNALYVVLPVVEYKDAVPEPKMIELMLKATSSGEALISPTLSSSTSSSSPSSSPVAPTKTTSTVSILSP